MKPSRQFRVIVYSVAALVYLSESKLFKSYVPENIRDFCEKYHNELLFAVYTFLVYYYSNLEYK